MSQSCHLLLDGSLKWAVRSEEVVGAVERVPAGPAHGTASGSIPGPGTWREEILFRA